MIGNFAAIGPTDVILKIMFGGQDQDEHVKAWRWAVYTNIFSANARASAYYLLHHGSKQ